MSVQDELATLRRSLAEMTRAAAALRTPLGDSRDLRRLSGALARVAEDLDDLAGAVPAAHRPPAAPDLSVQLLAIPDREPDPAMFEGCEDEGLGATWEPPRHAPSRFRRGR